MSKTVWGYWDCNFCDNKKIRGDNEECPSCGHPRSDTTKFYIDQSNIEYVAKEKTNLKPNWICSYCNTQNENYDDICEYCGASKAESKADYFEKHKSHHENEDYSQTSVIDGTNVECTTVDTSSYETDNPVISIAKTIKNHVNLKSCLLYGLIGIAAIAFVWFLIWFFTPVEHTANVSGFEWERSISIEQLTTFSESGWDLPAGARLQRTSEEIRSYDTVIDHYETKTKQVARDRIVGYEDYVIGYDDLGNGQFRERTGTRPIYETYYETETYQEPVYRQDPVYDTKYYYEIDRYVYERSIRSSGTDHEPYWGTVTLATKEREGDRTEYYRLICGEYSTTLSLKDWLSYNIGDNVIVTTNRTGNIVYSIEKQT